MDDHGASRHRPAMRMLAATALGAVLAVGGPAAAPALAASAMEPSWTATVDGRDVLQSTGDSAIPLRPAEGTRLEINVTNTDTEPLEIRAIRLQGQVIGLTFFSFTTQLGVTIPPGGSARRAIEVDLNDLAGQGVGLIPTRLALIGADREELGSRELVADVRGSLNSAYGVFGLAVGAITALLLFGLALDIARLQLPLNRWRRGVRFLPAGAGVGLTLTFTLSATRILSPSPTLWVPLVLGSAGVAFVIGYLTPVPDPDDLDDTAGSRRSEPAARVR